MQSSTRDGTLVSLLILVLVGAVGQITIGGITRVTGSGDGCPDWPTCFGEWIPPFEYHAIIEYGHRSVGVLLGLSIIVVCWRVYFKHKTDKTLVRLCFATLFLIIVVGLLGGAVVLNNLDPAIRTLHLMLAQIIVFLSVLCFVSATNSRTSNPQTECKWLYWSVSKKHKKNLTNLVISGSLILLTILSGSYAVWSQAGFYCTSWPFCGRGPFIPNEFLGWIHMLHRILSLISMVFAAYSIHQLFMGDRVNRIITRFSIVGLVLIVLQVFWGLLLPLTYFSEWSRAGHLSIATLIWTVVVFLITLILKPIPKNEKVLIDFTT